MPSGSTSVERRAIRDAASNAGASQVFLIEEPMAAAIGADMPVTEPIGSMVVDIGGGTTEVAVLSLRGLAYTTSVRVGGDKMDEAHRLLCAPSSQSADRRSHRRADQEAVALRASLRTASARRSTSRAATSSTAFPGNLDQPKPDRRGPGRADRHDRRGVRIALENTAPELAADIVDQGIVLTGGGALLKGLDEELRDATGLPVSVAEDPLTCVAIGTGRAMGGPDLPRRAAEPPEHRRVGYGAAQPEAPWA